MSPGGCHGCHRGSDAEVTQKEALKDHEKKTDVDYVTTNRKNSDSSPRECPSPLKQYPLLREALKQYYDEPGQESLYPSDRTVVDVMQAAGGATELEVIECLRYFYYERGLKPGTRNAPDHWSWFKTAVADYFRQKRDREEAANLSGYGECFERNGYRLTKREFDRMTEPIEIGD
jgi:hypothetical protein